ncbi:hypothetical protein [Burkholderia pseudomallei]|uniref:hypothetical protein n=1 Tax=Burkholderia pseudomallei TaxID=28450 RepID=UPI000F139D81|nr:hypothetical protein [Burkholderia pseudomallei]CAJ3070850.1 Uncharacterised protein [Burkholderia pseudomallei]VCK72950.1 Uncharacterised protein [Burkholderia pseudomallei]VCK79932.1 Uncharacterised protein [Burkholderia pseudomallei]VCK80090.1 Uncharacterised protein [Burkholderia pseudomallei]VCK80842.1 Uncharacterised protein [Burkholderia pseudomallei]
MRRLLDALLLAASGVGLAALGATLSNRDPRALAVALLALASSAALIQLKHALFGVR